MDLLLAKNLIAEQVAKQLNIAPTFEVNLIPNREGESHYISELLYDLAKTQKIRPSELATQISSLDIDGLSLRFKNDQLLVDFHAINLNEDFSALLKKQYRIITSTIANKASLAAQLRTLQVAYTHFHLLKNIGANVEFVVINESETNTYMDLDFKDLTGIIEDFKKQSKLKDAELKRRIEREQNAQIVLYLPLGILQKDLFNELYKSSYKTSCNTLVQENKYWSKDIPNEYLKSIFDTKNLSDFYQLAIFASSGIAASDLYPDEALLQQSNNLGWLADSIIKRLDLLEIETANESSKYVLLDYQHLQTKVLLSGHNLANSYANFLSGAGARELLSAFKQYLLTLNRYLNQPDLRQALNSEEGLVGDLKILSGIKAQINSMLTVLSFRS